MSSSELCIGVTNCRAHKLTSLISKNPFAAHLYTKNPDKQSNLRLTMSFWDDDADDDFDFGRLSLRSGVAKADENDHTMTNPPTTCVCNKSSSRPHVCKVYGKYRCDCGKWWTSGNSWYDFKKRTPLTQDCRGCNTPVQPHAFHKLRIGTDSNAGRGDHDVARCARCRQLGHRCNR